MAQDNQAPSSKSLQSATESRAKFSGHGNAKGAAGYDVKSVMRSECDELMESGETFSINSVDGGFGTIEVGAVWDVVKVKRAGILGKLFGLKKTINVDLDLGCLYELADGTRGAVQAFGDLYGSYDEAPYIKLSGDERTGEKEGFDESIIINGQKWSEIKRVLFYVYIYDGVADWAQVQPEIHFCVPGKSPLIVGLNTRYEELNLCLLAGAERVRNGIRIKNYTEYYPGHSEMDRAFGFGLNWGGGRKRPA